MKYESLKSLKHGQKYTLVGMSEFGFPYDVKITLEDVIFKPYAQYKEAAQLVFKQKGKRKLSALTIYGCKEILMWDGWIDVKTDVFVGEKNGSKESLLSFDSGYLDIAIASVKEKPVISIRREENEY
jgi:hypothetical protein